ncbi:MAG: rRNA pseudouridine synthase [Oscillospiraceae bacterium]|nr:rRNA pseudouridine synthase [Oscillospiraceae bacterium]MBR6561559.1 rRNA pseudouridine synthase [Oscillospiraceae bacterium]
MPTERIDKLIVAAGLASRSEAKSLIRLGRVLVDGVPVRDAAQKIDPEKQILSLDGEAVCTAKYRYFLLHKPAGVLSATEDSRQQTVLDLLPPELRRIGLFPAGRLDKDTTGLLLLTNDGELAHRLLSPKKHVEKRYLAYVEHEPNPDAETKFEQGMTLGDGTKCLPAQLERLGDGLVRVTVCEGKYHQVKRMLALCGAPVIRLHRESVGGLTLPDELAPGDWTELDAKTIQKTLEYI